MKSTEDRISYFFNKLEEIIDSPMTQSTLKVNALKVYGSMLPTNLNNDSNVKNEPIDLSNLSIADKKEFDKLLKQVKK